MGFDPNTTVATEANAWLDTANAYEPPGPDDGAGGGNGENGDPQAAGLSWPIVILGGGALAGLAYTLTRAND